MYYRTNHNNLKNLLPPQISFFKTEIFLVVQLFSHVRLFAIPWTAAHQGSLSFTISWSLFKFMSIELVMPSNHLILCRPLLLLPSIFPKIRVFSVSQFFPAGGQSIVSFNPSNEYSVCISFSYSFLLWFITGY